jgi:carboxylate-amine ligase
MDEHPTVGVEEEFLLVDTDNGEPLAANRPVAEEAERRGIKLQLELTSCQVETTTSVTAGGAELREQLTRLRRITAESAKACGAQLLAVALPPSVPHEFPVTDTPRYRTIAERFGMIAHEQGICGCHVHVEVPNRAAAVQVSNWLRPWLPLLLALTANSAVYRNTDTGYASWRSILWARWPSAGPPPFFASVDDYDSTVRMLIDTGADVPSTVAETVLLATLIRAAVMTALYAWRRDDTPQRPAPVALRAAYWRAARDGLDGQAIDLTGRPRLVPTCELLSAFVERIRPALDSLGEYQRVSDEVARVLVEGNGAMRQIRAWRRREDAGDVIAAAAWATIS